MVWDVIKIVLIVLGAAVGLVLALLLLLGIASCFNVGVRFSNFGEKLLVVRYGILRFKILPKKPKKELSEEEKQKREEKEKRRGERRKKRRLKWRERFEKRKMRRAVRDQRRKAKKASSKKKHAFSDDADWLSEPVEGKTRAVWETVFDVLPKAAKLLRFDNIRLLWIVRGESPAETGISYGRISALFGNVYPQLIRIFNVGKHNVRVDADFAHRGKSDTSVDVTVLLRPVKIVGLLFSFMIAWFDNKSRYCTKAKTSRTTVKMKSSDGGNKHGRKTEND